MHVHVCAYIYIYQTSRRITCGCLVAMGGREGDAEGETLLTILSIDRGVAASPPSE